MDVLLRELRAGPDGIIQYRDTEISGVDELTIGSGANQRLQLLGLQVAGRHAVIRRSGSRVELFCRRGSSVLINGKKAISARLRGGEVIEIGGHKLTVAQPPAGFQLALELRRNDSIDASEFEGAFRTDLSQTWLTKRPVSWALFVVMLLICLLAPLFIVEQYRIDTAGTYKQDSAVATPDWLPSDALWISGPLASFHDQAMGDRCDACHRGLFNRVQDKWCLECHGPGTGSVGTAAIVDHVSLERMQLTKLEPTERCAVCHREHDEPALPRLVDDSDKGCVKCHGESDALFGQIKLDQVKGFNAKRHPPFNAHLLKPKAIEPGGVMATSDVDRGVAPFEWVEEITATKGAKEQVNVKFSHNQHLDKERVYRPSADGNEALNKILNCVDCHRVEPEGEHFKPMTMLNTCSECHELTFDPEAPRRQLPHGQPREVIFKLQEHFALKFGNPANFKATALLGSASPRRMPGQSSNVPVPEGERFDADRGEEGIRTCTSVSFECAQKVSRFEIDLQFNRRGCVSCHVVLDTGADNLLDRYQVYPIRFQRDYFPAGRFPHKKHEIQGDLRGDEACLSCHAVKESKESSDLLMPDVDKCEECHGDTPARQRVVTKCVACHEYHPRPVFSDEAVAPVPVKPTPGMTAGVRGSAALTQQGSESFAAHTFAVAKHRQMFNVQRLNSLSEPLRSSLAKWRNSLDNVTTTSKTSARTVAQQGR
jgi:hypothetical protein